VIEAELFRLARKLQPGPQRESPRPRETFAEGLIPFKGRLIPSSIRRGRTINHQRTRRMSRIFPATLTKEQLVDRWGALCSRLKKIEAEIEPLKEEAWGVE
jgi:hypothetical protein